MLLASDKFPVPRIPCALMSSVGCLQCAERDQSPFRGLTAPMCGATLSHLAVTFMTQCASATSVFSHDKLPVHKTARLHAISSYKWGVACVSASSCLGMVIGWHCSSACGACALVSCSLTDC